MHFFFYDFPISRYYRSPIYYAVHSSQYDLTLTLLMSSAENLASTWEASSKKKTMEPNLRGKLKTLSSNLHANREVDSKNVIWDGSTRKGIASFYQNTLRVQLQNLWKARDVFYLNIFLRQHLFTSTFLWRGGRCSPCVSSSSVASPFDTAPSPRSRNSVRVLDTSVIVEGWRSEWSSSTNIADVLFANSELWLYHTYENIPRKKRQEHEKEIIAVCDTT